MITWIRQRMNPFFFGLLFASVAWISLGLYLVVQEHKARFNNCLPGVQEIDIQSLPPNAKNVTGLGNGWIIFELDVHGQNKVFIFKRPHSITQVN